MLGGGPGIFLYDSSTLPNRRFVALTDEVARVKALEQENRELRRANEILKRAATFFGAELDRQQRR